MRKLFLGFCVILTLLAIVFSVFPLDTLAFLPIGLAIVFNLTYLFKSEGRLKQITKYLLLICVICSFFVLVKTNFIKNTIEVDQSFENQKIETKSEAKKELEELENDLQ